MGIMAQSYPVQIHYETRTTRTPAFWDTPRPHDYPYKWFTSDPKSKQDKVKATNLKKNAKNSNFEILQETLHATHFLKLFDKMYKYEMDPTRTVGTTERTRNAGWTRDGRTDGRTDGVKPIYPPNYFVVQGV